MIAVTIGVGSYSEMAAGAARALAKHTGLPTRILGDEDSARSGLPDPMFMKFRLFDLVDEQDLLYFDADQVCLRPWDPTSLRDPHAIVAVRDRMHNAIRADIEQWCIPSEEYFNAGFMILNRSAHQQWLREAERFALAQPLRFGDQTALNVMRCLMNIPIRLVDRRYNWVGFGDGALCYQMPVVMAHSLLPDKRVNQAYHEGRYQLPRHPQIILDDSEAARLSGRSFTFIADGELLGHLTLREDGTTAPAAEPQEAGYWFVQRAEGRAVLTLASESEALHRCVEDGAGSWRSIEPVGEASLIPASSASPAHFLDEESARPAADRFVGSVEEFPSGQHAGAGVVICGGGRRFFPSAWVCIGRLRELGCQLPIELWHLGPCELDRAMAGLVEPLGVRCVDALEVRRGHPARILRGWELKPYALLHSRFQEALLLDADNVPMVNPEFLLESAAYREHGAVFWPDVSYLSLDHPIWRICGVSPQSAREFESGQILVDKSRCWRALQLAMHLNEHSDFYYRYLLGDKETYHMAWRMLDQPYAMVPTPPRRLSLALCQHDFAGRVIFQHRNGAKWVLGRNPHVRGFEDEEHGLRLLQDLARQWDGVVHCRPEYGPEDRALADAVAARGPYEYICTGQGPRPMELLEDGRIGAGRGDREEHWRIDRRADGVAELVLIGGGFVTCRLVEDGTGGWRGRWVIRERVPVELRPRSVEAQSEAIT